MLRPLSESANTQLSEEFTLNELLAEENTKALEIIRTGIADFYRKLLLQDLDDSDTDHAIRRHGFNAINATGSMLENFDQARIELPQNDTALVITTEEYTHKQYISKLPDYWLHAVNTLNDPLRTINIPSLRKLDYLDRLLALATLGYPEDTLFKFDYERLKENLGFFTCAYNLTREIKAIAWNLGFNLNKDTDRSRFLDLYEICIEKLNPVSTDFPIYIPENLESLIIELKNEFEIECHPFSSGYEGFVLGKPKIVLPAINPYSKKLKYANRIMTAYCTHTTVVRKPYNVINNKLTWYSNVHEYGKRPKPFRRNYEQTVQELFGQNQALSGK